MTAITCDIRVMSHLTGRVTARLCIGGLALAGCRDSHVATKPVPARVVDVGADITVNAGVSDAMNDAPTRRNETGPFEVPLVGKRTVYFVAPHVSGKQRLMAMLHGMCNPPGYACGLWAETAKDLGFLVCPTGDGTCGPAMYNAPTWTEPREKIDEDLELAITKVDARYPGELARDGAVLLGFSRGAYEGAKIAAAHPGRWPYLVLIEADVKLSKKMLDDAGVRAVALMAGEIGGQIAGERKTATALAAQGFPAKLWVMRKAAHHYSDDIESLMREAITWVTMH
jgi:hypothetical protein